MTIQVDELTNYEREVANPEVTQKSTLKSGEWIEFYLNIDKEGNINKISYTSYDNTVIRRAAEYFCNKETRPKQIKWVHSVERGRSKYLIKYEDVCQQLNIVDEQEKVLVKLVVKTLNHCFDIWQFRNARTANIFKKTGMFYSYKRTFLVFIIFMVLNWVGWILGGIKDITTPQTFFDFILPTAMLPFAIIFIIFLVRGSSDKLKDITFENPEKFRKLFSNDYYFERYRWNFDRRTNPVYFRTFGIIILVFIFLLYSLFLYGGLIIEAIGNNNWFTVIGCIANAGWFSIFYCFMSVAIAQVFNLTATIAQLGYKIHHLSIISIKDFDIEELKGKKSDEVISFLNFHRYTKEIGGFMFRLILYLIIIIVCFDLIFFGWTPILTYFLLIVTFLCVFLFIYPQLSIHRILKNTKEQMINLYQNIYGKLRLEVLALYKAQENPDVENRITQINFIKEEIEYTKEFGTWAYDFPKVLKLVVAACLSFIPIILEIFKV